ncbi:hypothetical protein D3C81_2310720 [compost metagenome]
MRDRCIKIVDHADRQYQIEEFGGIVVLAGRGASRQQRPRALVCTQLHATFGQRQCSTRQERCGNVPVHQQGLQ